METQKLLHAAGVKQAQKRAVESNKPKSNSKRMKARKAMDTYGSEACTRARHYLPVPSQYKGGGPWVRVKKRYGLAVGRRGSLF